MDNNADGGTTIAALGWAWQQQGGVEVPRQQFQVGSDDGSTGTSPATRRWLAITPQMAL